MSSRDERRCAKMIELTKTEWIKKIQDELLFHAIPRGINQRPKAELIKTYNEAVRLGLVKLDIKVYEGKIRGEKGNGNKLFLVNWFYMANFGTCMAYAKDEKEAIDNTFALYSRNKKVRFQVTEVNPESMPVLFNYGAKKGDE
jgi:hypothetical protein